MTRRLCSAILSWFIRIRETKVVRDQVTTADGCRAARPRRISNITSRTVRTYVGIEPASYNSVIYEAI